MKDYLVLRGNTRLKVNADHEHLANATTIAKAESRAHPKADVVVYRLIVHYRNGIEVAANRRSYQHRREKGGVDHH